MVFAETSSVAKTTARQMLRMKAFTLPMLLMKLSWNAFSLSVFVGSGELRNMASTPAATLGTSSGEPARILKVPAWTLEDETASCRYFRLQYTLIVGWRAGKIPPV